MKGGFILYNGKFYPEKEFLFSADAIFRLGNGIRESFRTENNVILFGRDYYDYLVNALMALHYPTPDEWSHPRFMRDVARLLNKNHYYLAAKVTLHLIPGSDGTDYHLTAEELPRGYFPLDDQVRLVDFLSSARKGASVHSILEVSSRFIWNVATRTALEKNLDNLIILNDRGLACESIGGSFAYLVGDKVCFPGPQAHGYSSPIVAVVMECCENMGLSILEVDKIKPEMLLDADELFLIDNCKGILPVTGLAARRYYSDRTREIALHFSEMVAREHPRE